MGKKIRIGIDVGGTFTDAIALDNETYEIIGIKKVHTTHYAEEGVTRGVIDILNMLMEEIHCSSEDVVFIAHGTTQATNALLEGDVADIGILGMGSGLGMAKVKADTDIGEVKLEGGKQIKTAYQFINTGNGVSEEAVIQAIEDFKKKHIKVLVVSEAFSVDNPENEQKAADAAAREGMMVTATHELSKLYGLRARTKTAVINASILPKMMQTADLTSRAVKDAQIKAPLMIMRSDGGVMQIEEVKKRPILTVLSGPAAGVAGALMYERISDGIFLEVGGTSTDISAIKNGKVLTKYAKIGGIHTYVTSLDIHTIGIGGGSMIRYNQKKIIDVGPRSAHIAGLAYACFANAKELEGAKAIRISTPKDKTCDFLALETKAGKRYAVTLTCTANYLGKIEEGDYAKANPENVRIIFEALERDFGCPAQAIALEIMALAVAKVAPAVEAFVKEYNLSKSHLVLTGGGGGASSVTPYVAQKMQLQYRAARNAAVISTIGAALAMVRDSVERTIVNPTQDDIMKIRNEAEQAAIRSGASPDSIEITIDLDTAKNIVRATAVGATTLSAKTSHGKALSNEQIKNKVIEAFGDQEGSEVNDIYHSPTLHAFDVISVKRGILPFMKKKVRSTCVADINGVIRLNVDDGDHYLISEADRTSFGKRVQEHMKFDESGKTAPVIHLVVNGKIADLSGLDSEEQIIALADLEFKRLMPGSDYLAIIKKR